MLRKLWKLVLMVALVAVVIQTISSMPEWVGGVFAIFWLWHLLQEKGNSNAA